MFEIERNLYLEKLKEYLDIEQIKIISGVRRCGKSYLLNQIVQHIRSRGIADDHIIFIPLEEYSYRQYTDPDYAYTQIKQQLKDDQKYYIFIDEVQLMDDWQRVINSLRLYNTSIFVTGSNSQMLEGELATLLTGRYVKFELRPISFQEFKHTLTTINPEVIKGTVFEHLLPEQLLDMYIKKGGYPIVIANNFPDSLNKKLVNDICIASVHKDVFGRTHIRDQALADRIIEYLFCNTGNLISVTNIVNYLNSHKVKANDFSIRNYLFALQQSYLFEKVPRYDIHSKSVLNVINKYYPADHSLMYMVMNENNQNQGQILETIVYNELRSREYQVYVGKIGEYEVDFIAEKDHQKIYIQVTYELGGVEHTKRELRPLQLIHDHYHKYVVTMKSPLYPCDFGGITCLGLYDFLLKKEL